MERTNGKTQAAELEERTLDDLTAMRLRELGAHERAIVAELALVKERRERLVERLAGELAREGLELKHVDPAAGKVHVVRVPPTAEAAE
jgi:hypothetical protein